MHQHMPAKHTPRAVISARKEEQNKIHTMITVKHCLELSPFLQLKTHHAHLQKTQQVWKSIVLFWSIFCDQLEGCLPANFHALFPITSTFNPPLKHCWVMRTWRFQPINLARKSSDLCIATWRITRLLHSMNLCVLQIVNMLNVTPNICSNPAVWMGYDGTSLVSRHLNVQMPGYSSH